ncbi:MAG: diacylglycerol kinase [Comamonas sp.]
MSRPPTPDPYAQVNPQKARTGLSRIWHAAGYSVAGLKAAWREKAFRQEVLAAVVMLPAAAWLARDWREWALLAMPVVLVLVVELLNSAVEAAIDRFGPQWHELSKNAKDMGSAAVLLSILLCIAVWGAALYERFA